MAMLARLALLLLATSIAPAVHAEKTRSISFRYETAIGPIPVDAGPVHVFIPLAMNDADQTVMAEQIDATIPGAVETEDVYGNRFWHGQIERSDGRPIAITVDTTVERTVQTKAAAGASQGPSAREREELRRFLASNERVVVGHPILDPILSEIRSTVDSDDKAATARAIYDWVVDNVEYKKIGRGWGNGDTFWACNERYGNCTDFHALFISLARSEGIPARFEIGFPAPEDDAPVAVGGYHCWVEFYLPETGWFPIDASEAAKHPEKRELLYGTQPADRIHLSTGRDLRLGPDHRDAPLNYFVYPHVEVAGTRWQDAIQNRFVSRGSSPTRKPGRDAQGVGP